MRRKRWAMPGGGSLGSTALLRRMVNPKPCVHLARFPYSSSLPTRLSLLLLPTHTLFPHSSAAGCRNRRQGGADASRVCASRCRGTWAGGAMSFALLRHLGERRNGEAQMFLHCCAVALVLCGASAVARWRRGSVALMLCGAGALRCPLLLGQGAPCCPAPSVECRLYQPLVGSDSGLRTWDSALGLQRQNKQRGMQSSQGNTPDGQSPN
eukprot:353135-Chlamydomonas_euryale.AAC.3